MLLAVGGRRPKGTFCRGSTNCLLEGTADGVGRRGGILVVYELGEVLPEGNGVSEYVTPSSVTVFCGDESEEGEAAL